MKVTTSFCRGCIYQGYAGGNQKCCDYIFKTGKRRPCPPGKECTVKTTERKLKKATPKPRVHGTKKNCEFCGVEFTLQNNSKQKYCCSKCKDSAYRKARQERKYNNG